jgi:IPT/TIG domain-containing protein
MRKISVAITAAALAVSMLAMAIPAAAVAGYDSAYAGESAFVTLAAGQSNEFQVFFANTGTTTWTRGTGSQVDLASCLADKTTCNAQDASEAPWNSGWLSATRYATTTQTAVSPGSIATFKYTVMAPSGVAAGTYRFNGDLVLSATGEKIHPEGYFQDATVGGAGTGNAATLVALSPATVDIAGGTVVTVQGTNFACTPSFPAVDFGGAAGTVTSCGSTALTVTAPAHASGTVNVTATNSGAGPSNALLVTYKDLTAPTFKQLSASGGTNMVQVAMSESSCNWAVLAAADFSVTVNGNPATVGSIRRPQGTDLTANTTCGTGIGRGGTFDANSGASYTAIDLQVTPTVGPATISNGDFITVTITCTATDSTGCTAGGASKIQDLAGNVMQNAQTVTGTATADTTKPSMSSTTTLNATSIRTTWSEPVLCGTGNSLAAGQTATFLQQFTVTVGGNSYTPTSVTCPANNIIGATRLTLVTTQDVSAGGFVTYQQSATTAERVKDLAGNDGTSPQTISFAPIAAATPPVISAASITSNVGSTNFGDLNDTFTLTFNEQMNTTTAIVIAVTDSDPGTNKDFGYINCNVAGNNSVCTWNTGGTVLTVRVGTAFTGGSSTSDGTTAGTNGTTPGFQLPLTITATTGITDFDDSVPPNLSASDKVID